MSQPSINSQRDMISTMPTELLQEVFQHAPIKQLHEMRHVFRLFDAVIKNIPRVQRSLWTQPPGAEDLRPPTIGQGAIRNPKLRELKLIVVELRDESAKTRTHLVTKPHHIFFRVTSDVSGAPRSLRILLRTPGDVIRAAGPRPGRRGPWLKPYERVMIGKREREKVKLQQDGVQSSLQLVRPALPVLVDAVTDGVHKQYGLPAGTTMGEVQRCLLWADWDARQRAGSL